MQDCWEQGGKKPGWTGLEFTHKQKAEMVKWYEGLSEVPVVTKDGKLLAEGQERFTCLLPTAFHFLTTTFNVRR